MIKIGTNFFGNKILLVISKWDLSGRKNVANKDELEGFIKVMLPLTNQLINKLKLDKTYFTVIDFIIDDNEIRTPMVNMASGSLLSNWLYKKITGFPLDYDGTFWERIKFSLFP